MGITLFLYWDDALDIGSSYVQTRSDGQRVVSLLQRLGFIMNPNKCKFKYTLVFNYMGLAINIREMTMSLPPEILQAIKAQGTKLSSFPMCSGVMRLLGLMKLVNMTLLLARLHSHLLQFWLREIYKSPANLITPLKFTQEARRTLLW